MLKQSSADGAAVRFHDEPIQCSCGMNSDRKPISRIRQSLHK